MAREFKPVRFFALVGIALFLTCGAVGFFGKRTEHGRAPAQRETYAFGFEARKEALPDVKLSAPAALNIMAQARFKGEGSKSDWNLAFENGYEPGFRKTHPSP